MREAKEVRGLGDTPPWDKYNMRSQLSGFHSFFISLLIGKKDRRTLNINWKANAKSSDPARLTPELKIDLEYQAGESEMLP
jgi:hypothetical protein